MSHAQLAPGMEAGAHLERKTTIGLAAGYGLLIGLAAVALAAALPQVSIDFVGGSSSQYLYVLFLPLFALLGWVALALWEMDSRSWQFGAGFVSVKMVVTAFAWLAPLTFLDSLGGGGGALWTASGWFYNLSLALFGLMFARSRDQTDGRWALAALGGGLVVLVFAILQTLFASWWGPGILGAVPAWASFILAMRWPLEMVAPLLVVAFLRGRASDAPTGRANAYYLLAIALIPAAMFLGPQFAQLATSAPGGRQYSVESVQQVSSSELGLCGRWEVTVGSEGRVAKQARVRSVAAVAGMDVWAVSEQYVLHWDGKVWGEVAVPRARQGTDSYFTSVAGSSPTDVWIAGYSDQTTLTSLQGEWGLSLHWDGNQWSEVPIPDMGSFRTRLSAVTVTSPTDAWAVGGTFDEGLGLYDLRVLHWDGRSWTDYPLPPVPPLDEPDGFKVSAAAPDDAWVVGLGLSLHWDGKAWSNQPLPLGLGPAASDTSSCLSCPSSLEDLSASGPENVWAVGLTKSAVFGNSYYRDLPLAVRWDGAAWRQVPVPDEIVNSDGGRRKPLGAGVPDDLNWMTLTFRSVLALPDGHAWAVADPWASAMFLMRWDGKQWKKLPTPTPRSSEGYYDYVDLAISPSGDIWAVGGSTSTNQAPPDNALMARFTPQECPKVGVRE